MMDRYYMLSEGINATVSVFVVQVAFSQRQTGRLPLVNKWWKRNASKRQAS